MYKYKKDGFPISCLRFALTSHCNMYCKHCYNNSGACNSVPDEMTPQKWIEFSKYIVAHGGVMECHISGGEPFLIGDAIFDIMDILHDDGTEFLLLTNGYLLTEERAKRLGKYNYHWVQISIDSTDYQYHDNFRKLPGCWDKAVQAARAVASYGMPLKIAHCVTPCNLDGIDEMCELAYSIGAACIIVGEVCMGGRAAINRDLFLSSEQKKILHDKFQENYSKYEGRMIVKTSHTVRSGLEKHYMRPRSKAIIRSNGDVRLDDMAPFVVGNILKEDFAYIWKNKIDKSWKNPMMEKYISDFDNEDKNHFIINYIDKNVQIS